MGCLNANQGFEHWFGNIHLSGPCNRACYFCIGQHMMALDHYNNLETWPLVGLDKFVAECIKHNIYEINVTGTNTDSLLFRHLDKLHDYLITSIPDLVFGARTNGVLVEKRVKNWQLFNKASVTICSLDPVIYRQMMGRGSPPDIKTIMSLSGHMRDVKVNIVLGPENTQGDLERTLQGLLEAGVKRVNLREPYGQPHVGDPLRENLEPSGERLGMPFYRIDDMDVMYWDVHYVEVESVNLYASGRVSETYPITAGHAPQGFVKDQRSYPGGRIQDQWLRNAERSMAAVVELRERLLD